MRNDEKKEMLLRQRERGDRERARNGEKWKTRDADRGMVREGERERGRRKGEKEREGREELGHDVREEGREREMIV